MENTINQRIKDAIEKSEKKIVYAFSKATGVSQQRLSLCVNGQTEPRASLLMSVLNGLPELSAEWLMRGEGTMWKGDVNKVVTRRRAMAQYWWVMVAKWVA